MPSNQDGLELGLSATKSLVVEGNHLYSPTGKVEHSVLSSPAMIMEMEITCVEAVNGIIEASVGFHVDVKHIAPTPAGESVETTATLIEINVNKLRCKVETTYGETLVGTGTHRRAIVDL